MNVENTSIHGAKNVDVMMSQCPQKNRKFYSSFANQIMRNKKSALQYRISYLSFSALHALGSVYSFKFAQSYFRPTEIWDWFAQSWIRPLSSFII